MARPLTAVSISQGKVISWFAVVGIVAFAAGWVVSREAVSWAVFCGY